MEVGDSYTAQPPTITIAFTDGAVEPIGEAKNKQVDTDKIHRLCMIMDTEDYSIFTDAMELHYIDMRAFAKAVNEKGSISIDDTEETMFAKWLSIITQKEIQNKEIIKNACNEEEILMAVTALQLQSEDKIIRQAYQRRKDEIYFYNKTSYERDEYMLRAEQERQRANQLQSENEQERQRAEQERQRANQLQSENEQERQRSEQLQSENEQQASELEILRRQVAQLQASRK